MFLKVGNAPDLNSPTRSNPSHRDDLLSYRIGAPTANGPAEELDSTRVKGPSSNLLEDDPRWYRELAVVIYAPAHGPARGYASIKFSILPSAVEDRAVADHWMKQRTINPASVFH